MTAAGIDPLAVLAEPRRRAIVRMVWRSELPAGAIAAAMPDITFGAVSQHLRVLRDAGLVTVRPEGRQRIYRADRQAFGPLAEALDTMWAARLDALAALAEADEHPAGGPTEETIL